MDKVILTTKLSIEDYIKVNYHLLNRRWPIKALTGMGIFLILLSLINLFSGDNSWFLLILGLFFAMGLRVSVYFNAKSSYKSDGRISETITYEFDKENIQVIGESFNSKLTWDKIYSVTENKEWVLIWQNRQIANVVPKRDFKDGELQTLKGIIKLQSGLKNKLKK
jgi:hypothetical protein